MKSKWRIAVLPACVILAAVTASAFAAGDTKAAPPSPPPVHSASPVPSAPPIPTPAADSGYWGKNYPSYTKEDYNWALACQVSGYLDMPADVYDGLVFPWKDEEAFHRAEEAFGRLNRGLEETDPLYSFIDRIMSAAVDNASCKHYRGSCDRWTPSFHDSIEAVRTEDVFGDAYPVFEASANFIIRYQIPGRSAITVGERDTIFQAYRDGLQAFFSSKTEAEQKNYAAMKTALEAELRRLDQTHSSDNITLNSSTLTYYNVWDRRDEY